MVVLLCLALIDSINFVTFADASSEGMDSASVAFLSHHQTEEWVAAQVANSFGVPLHMISSLPKSRTDNLGISQKRDH